MSRYSARQLASEIKRTATVLRIEREALEGAASIGTIAPRHVSLVERSPRPMLILAPRDRRLISCLVVVRR